ncbi:MAG: protein-glutamate O-methyltransferase CheR [Sphingobium sp.]
MKAETLTPAMRMLASTLEARTGQILSESRLWRLETSLKPVLRANGLRTLDHLAAKIEAEPNGVLAVDAVNALLNNETSFFRDAHIFRLLAEELLPGQMERIMAEGRHKKQLRIWCAGCSTGQEAFSLAMMFRNRMENWPGWRLQILATDVSRAAIDRARSGLVPQMEVQRGLPINDLLRWMEPDGDQWRVSSELRQMIDFRVDNLCAPSAPSGDYDLIFCRNVLLYFNGERKKQIFSLLARHCAINGYLLLGAGETVIGHTDDFVASQRFRGTYQRIDTALLAANI